MQKKHRIFFHFYKQYNCMSVHYRGQCYKVENVICNISVRTKWRSQQPKLVMEGFASDLIVDNKTAIIN